MQVSTLNQDTASLGHDVAYLSLVYRNTKDDLMQQTGLASRQRAMLLHRVAAHIRGTTIRHCCRAVRVWWSGGLDKTPIKPISFTRVNLCCTNAGMNTRRLKLEREKEQRLLSLARKVSL